MYHETTEDNKTNSSVRYPVLRELIHLWVKQYHKIKLFLDINQP